MLSKLVRSGWSQVTRPGGRGRARGICRPCSRRARLIERGPHEASLRRRHVRARRQPAEANGRGSERIDPGAKVLGVGRHGAEPTTTQTSCPVPCARHRHSRHPSPITTSEGFKRLLHGDYGLAGGLNADFQPHGAQMICRSMGPAERVETTSHRVPRMGHEVDHLVRGSGGLGFGNLQEHGATPLLGRLRGRGRGMSVAGHAGQRRRRGEERGCTFAFDTGEAGGEPSSSSLGLSRGRRTRPRQRSRRQSS